MTAYGFEWLISIVNFSAKEIAEWLIMMTNDKRRLTRNDGEWFDTE